ncbi:MCE family protein [Rhodococcus triatomae]|uniref:Phospholipid/cholesterol/gamma-HCH transport system substrate-binding protein n=1 Tax=Rhodococcus triatomae TaxID=300028 RepID=A0A1G8JDW0_9NOCA|nr:MCE family protein [Rhodococcus triatomae]QNG19740.1 MCE family protein [Rhodococcus triatomae]QNG24344.1 MCE family protein [Rhodococcus triatomae]SDI29386.1 phospholipid/cholesterol/gamma-HCH transport system substrate-binding protein [Rhodococcus triatomae]
MRKSLVLGAGAVAVAFAVTSCSSQGIYSLPLPGGADVGSDPMTLTIQFDDVLDLVPQTAVKVEGVPVGRVRSIDVGDDGWTADVEILLDSTVDLPANALASIDQTNLLGEKFIQLSPPTDAAQPRRLSDGDVIPLQNTRQSTEIEQVLGALSLLLNGGGVGQLQPVIHELSTAFDGREGRVKELLHDANDLIGGLNEQRDDITRALDGLDVLNSRIVEQNEKIAQILEQLPVATEVLEQQRPQLTQMLVQLDRLGTVGTDVINQSKDDLIKDLLALRPTLQALADAGQDLPDALPFLPTVPFPDGVEKIALGGSVNLFLSVDLQIGETLDGLGVGQGDPVYVPPRYGQPQPVIDPSNPWYGGNGARPGWPTVSLLPILPPVPALGAPPAPAAGEAPPPNPLEGLLEQFGIGGGR